MPRNSFLKIMRDVRDYDSYFICKSDTTGKLSFTSHQKCSATIHILIYGNDGDLIDEYLQMSETPYLDAMYKFCKVVIAAYLLSLFLLFLTIHKEWWLTAQPGRSIVAPRTVSSHSTTTVDGRCGSGFLGVITTMDEDIEFAALAQ
jgi:hypothetical protein